MVIRYIKFEEKHIPEVRELFNTYLVPTLYKRLGITKQQITGDIIELEDVVHPDVVSFEIYRECSLVCVDTDDNSKVVGCQLNYFLDEDRFNACLVEAPKKYLKLSNKSKKTREYAEYLLNVYDGHDLFNRYNLKRILYLESSVILPEFRGQNIMRNLMKKSADYFTKEGDGVLAESLIPLKKMKKIKEQGNFEQNYVINGGIFLREVISNGFVCVLVLNVIANKLVTKKVIDSKL